MCGPVGARSWVESSWRCSVLRGFAAIGRPTANIGGRFAAICRCLRPCAPEPPYSWRVVGTRRGAAGFIFALGRPRRPRDRVLGVLPMKRPEFPRLDGDPAPGSEIPASHASQGLGGGADGVGVWMGRRRARVVALMALRIARLSRLAVPIVVTLRHKSRVAGRMRHGARFLAGSHIAGRHQGGVARRGASSRRGRTSPGWARACAECPDLDTRGACPGAATRPQIRQSSDLSPPGVVERP